MQFDIVYYPTLVIYRIYTDLTVLEMDLTSPLNFIEQRDRL